MTILAESVSNLNTGENQACILSYKKQKGKKNKWRLGGQGVLPLDGTAQTLDLECDVANDPKDGSCWAHAVLRAIHALDIDQLEVHLRACMQVCSEDLSWTAGFFIRLREWKAFGEQSMTSRKSTNFREHVARRLLDAQNAAQCGKRLENVPSEYGVDAASMAAAIARAKQLAWSTICRNLGNVGPLLC